MNWAIEKCAKLLAEKLIKQKFCDFFCSPFKTLKIEYVKIYLYYFPSGKYHYFVTPSLLCRVVQLYKTLLTISCHQIISLCKSRLARGNYAPYQYYLISLARNATLGDKSWARPTTQQRRCLSNARWKKGRWHRIHWSMLDNNGTLWLHLERWILPKSHLSWESKMEPSVAYERNISELIS